MIWSNDFSEPSKTYNIDKIKKQSKKLCTITENSELFQQETFLHKTVAEESQQMYESQYLSCQP